MCLSIYVEEAKKCITDLKENVAQSEVKINLECLKADFEEGEYEDCYKKFIHNEK